MKDIERVRRIIREEIGRNYHTVNNDPNTWESFQDYEIESYPQENGEYTISVSYKGQPLVKTARFKNETECKHFARMVVDKHRVFVMNK